MLTLRSDNRGQSFIEAMVAITIIITSVSSALALVQSSINASRIGGSQIVAANLAREGVEVVRAMRDSNWLQGNAFSVGLSDAEAGSVTARPRFDAATAEWTLDFTALTFSDPSAQLELSPQGLYLYPDDAPANSAHTLYKRLLTVGRICRDGSGNERIVAADGETCTSSVETWVGLDVTSQAQYVSTGGAANTITAEERLYDWR